MGGTDGGPHSERYTDQRHHETAAPALEQAATLAAAMRIASSHLRSSDFLHRRAGNRTEHASRFAKSAVQQRLPSHGWLWVRL